MRNLCVVGLALALSTQATAQTISRSSEELATRGPQVGQAVPEFKLVDQAGATRDLESILGANGALLVFYRSAEW